MSEPQYYHKRIGWRNYPQEHKMAQMGISTRTPEVVPTPIPPPIPVYKCNYCDASFGAPGSLQNHIAHDHMQGNTPENYHDGEPDFGDYNSIIEAQVSMGKTREEAWEQVKQFKEYTRQDFEDAYDGAVMIDLTVSARTGKPSKAPTEEQQKIAQKILDTRSD